MADRASGNSSPNAAEKLRLPATCEPPSEQNPPGQAVWVIFGAAGHMGHALGRAAIAHGDQVTAVGWTAETNIKQFQQHWNGPQCLGLLCDVRVRETVDLAIRKSIEQWGHIDIIVNCAGYGVIAACEDQDEHEIRNQFETNFLGTLNILQLSLPHFKEQLHGRYLIFSSLSGALGVPGLGPFCATKYAVEALVESMLYEIDCFGIKATLIEPGHARNDDPDGLGKRFSHFYVKNPASEPYSSQNSPAKHFERTVRWLNDRQPTSSIKSAELIWQLGHCSYPPLRLLLGSYAVDSIRDRLKSITEEIEDWKHLNFPAPSDVMPTPDVEMG